MVSMDNDDPHFGWEIGQFFVGGYTDYENNKDGNPVFLKNNGDRLSLWFELKQDINKCYNNKSIRVIADTAGSDAEFEVPGGVNETTDYLTFTDLTSVTTGLRVREWWAKQPCKVGYLRGIYKPCSLF